MNILEYENYHEKKSHGNPLFPYNTYLCTIPLDFTQVPLHWHDEAELIYVKRGILIITVDFVPHTVCAGAIAFILPGQLHSMEQFADEVAEYENILFHPDILLSKKTDTSNTDFLLPLFSGALTVPVLYTPDSPHYAEIAACIDANDTISRTNPEGYQLFIKSQLFMFFFLLANKCLSGEVQKKDYKSLEKIKVVLKYVETHYMEKIKIEDMAKVLDISQSHFMKYFKNTMGTSFIDYLNEYRLTLASRLLVSSDSSILTIASEVGYDNLSYFNRIFKRRFGMTPREFRAHQ